MSDRKGTLVWFRRDLRLSDHVALSAACARREPVIPVFILDPVLEEMGGAAAQWRWSIGLDRLSQSLRAAGSRLIIRRGEALETLKKLAVETGARRIHWSRLYDPESIERDTAVKSGLKAAGLEAESFEGHLLHEPFKLKTKTGGYFKVYTPFWRACLAANAPEQPLPAPAKIPAPEAWPASDTVESLGLERAMNRGAAVVKDFARVGEAAARDRLDAFIDASVASYHDDRDRTDRDGTSKLSENLALGELSPRAAWHAAEAAAARDPKAAAGAEVFRKELVWRDFAWHLLYHTPHIATQNWRDQWDAFPWRADNDDAEAWRRGRTGQPFIDAAMRELYVTGTMHNRTRMLTASFLTKHLMTDWRVGEAWFRDCLIDWDPASNAMGWQWAAGSGPDAAPFFRIFNPETQSAKFDPAGDYVNRWLPEYAASDLSRSPHQDGLKFFDACPSSWSMSPQDAYPDLIISLASGRQRALNAYADIAKQSPSKPIVSKEIIS